MVEMRIIVLKEPDQSNRQEPREIGVDRRTCQNSLERLVRSSCSHIDQCNHILILHPLTQFAPPILKGVRFYQNKRSLPSHVSHRLRLVAFIVLLYIRTVT